MKHRCDVQTYGVCALNRFMCDASCANLWGLYRSNNTTPNEKRLHGKQ